MDMMRMLDTRIEHRHGDDWHPLRLAAAEHGSGPSDPERAWGSGRLYRCVDCDEEIRVAPIEEGDTAPGRARR
jgi:hypothetical protein